jgi:hypothetical protein
MNDTVFNQDYWDNRWKNQETGWDIGQVSPALAHYFQQIVPKTVRLLIPGCGNAHEAMLLVKMGFTNITLLDISPTLVADLRQKLAQTSVKIICSDFFEHQGEYDYIIEQTFFCALHPSLRSHYAQKMAELLAKKGKLAGLLFNKDFGNPTPPFGGSIAEYEQLFSPYFDIHHLAHTDLSITPRKGTEVFFEASKK